MAVPSDGAAHQHVAKRHQNRAQAIEVSVGSLEGRDPGINHQTASPSMTAESDSVPPDQAAMPQSITLATHATAAVSNRTR
jgi:hypothetical protein